jgi:hypothetical protein
MAKENPEKVKNRHRVITLLDRQEIDFLDKLGKDALFSTGHKLAHSEILKTLVDLAMQTGVSGEKVDSPSALEEKILQKIQAGLARVNFAEELKKKNEG